MASWLQKKRKGDLVDLAEATGMEGAAMDMRKDDLIIALEQHLHYNASSLQSYPDLKDYWNRVASPLKKEAEAVTSHFKDSPSKSAVRRAKSPARAKSPIRRALSEIESSPEPIRSILKKTPTTIRKAAKSFEESFQNLPDLPHVPLPTSPAEVANLVERRASIIKEDAQEWWYSTGITASLENTRTKVSTIASVQLFFLLLEAYGLQQVTIPWRFAFSLPAMAPFTADPTRVSFPDFFVLLNASYWAPGILWAMTSLLLPSIVAWFINFTTNKSNRHARAHGYEVDPFVFNITRMLTAWLVYRPSGLRLFGIFSEHTVATVQAAMPGGAPGLMASSAIGAAMSLYEAVLRR